MASTLNLDIFAVKSVRTSSKAHRQQIPLEGQYSCRDLTEKWRACLRRSACLSQVWFSGDNFATTRQLAKLGTKTMMQCS